MHVQRNNLFWIVEEIVPIQRHRNLVLAMINVESGGRLDAVSPDGSYGLMQVRKCVWKDRFDFDAIQKYPEYAVWCGYDILAQCLRASHGDIQSALFKYNHSGDYIRAVLTEQEKLCSNQKTRLTYFQMSWMK